MFSQIFLWNNGIFEFHHELPVSGVLGVEIFSRGGSTYLVVVPSNSTLNTLLYQWSENKFRQFHEIPVSGITQVKALTSGSDIYLIFGKGIHACKISSTVSPVTMEIET